MTTITPAYIKAIGDRLAAHPLSHGIGTEDAACSIASINLALTGHLTDDIPECMSAVIGEWIIVIQDAMPLDRINAPRWRDLLPLAAGTGRAHEHERLKIIMDWMWDDILPKVQPMADANGFGVEWLDMCNQRTAASAAWAADEAAAWAAKAVARAASEAASEAARAAARAASEAARAAAWAAAAAARAASEAARAAGVAEINTSVLSWDTIDPEGLLDYLIRAGEPE